MLNAHVPRLPKQKTGPITGINVIGMHSHEGGLGAACRMNAKALEQIYGSEHTHHIDFPVPGNNDVQKLKPRFNLNYLHFSPDHISVDAARREAWFMRRNIGYFAWETTMPPESWRKINKDLEQIWVPSNFVMSALVSAGFSKPIFVIPHACTVPSPSRLLTQTRDKLTFLVTFDGKSRLERKRPDLALAAIRMALHESKERGKVIIKCNDVKMQGLDAIIRSASALCASLGGLGPLELSVHDKWVSDSKMESILSQADILVSLNRGEGFGLPLLEAMANGVSVVATGWGGATDFLNDRTGFPVWENRLVAVSGDDYYKTGKWAEPHMLNAVHQIREAMTEIREGKYQRRRDALKMARSFSHERLVSNMQEALKQLA